MTKPGKQCNNMRDSANGHPPLLSTRLWAKFSLLALLIAVGYPPVFADGPSDDFQLIWAKVWRDNHFQPDAAYATGYGITIDHSGCIYIAGNTRDTLGAPWYGYIMKTDQDLNEIWYRRDYIPPTSWITGIHRITLASDGNLVAHATAVFDGQAYVRLMKIDSRDGSVIWQTDVARGNEVYDIWGDGAGPALDRQGNIYVASGKGSRYWNHAEPLGIYKFDSNGNLLWSREDHLCGHYSDAFGWCDVWELVVDSEDSVYVSAVGWFEGRQFDFGLLKYNADGNYAWTRISNRWSCWDSPRGLAIDSQDHIYQTGNGGGRPARAGAIVYDKEGNTLYKGLLYDFSSAYPYGTAVDKDGNLIIHGATYEWFPISEIAKYKYLSSELVKIASIEYQFPNRMIGQPPSRTAVDPWGNTYCLQWFESTDYSGAQVGIIKVGTPPAADRLSWVGLSRGKEYATDGVGPESAAAGTEFDFLVKYTDAAGNAPATVKLHLALNGKALADSPLTMINETDSTGWAAGVTFAAPGVQLTEPGVYVYRFRAYDSTGFEIAACPPVSVAPMAGPIVVPACQHTFSAGRMMVGMPLQVTGFPTMEDLLGIADNKVGWWDPSASDYITFDAPTDYLLGRGYWADLDDETQVEIAATALTSQFTYDVRDGWNIVGSPYLPEIGLESITGAPTLRPFAWTDQGNGYELVAPITDSLNLIHNTLKPWWGYWVLSDGDGTITWSQTSPSAQNVELLQIGRADVEQGGWQIQLTAKAGSRSDLCNYCGVADEQTAQALSIANPPPASGSVDLYFPNQAGPMATDIRPSSEAKLTWNFEVRTDLSDTEVTIGYPDLSVLPNDYRLTLTDLDADKSTYMRTTAGYTYNSGLQGGVRHFQITAAPKTQTSLLVTGVTAQQVNGQQVAITYTLSAAAQVDIQIRNIAGRVIRQVQADALQPAGSNTAPWNLANASGSRIPAGTYLCVITARTEHGQQATCLRPVAINR